MATLAELKSKLDQASVLCQAELWPKVDRFERENIVDATELKEQFKLAVLPAVAGFAIGFFHFGLAPYLRLGLYAAAAIFLGPALFRYLKQAVKRAKAMEALKIEIKALALRFIDPALVFTPRLPFPEALYHGCGLFPESYDRAHAEDHCAGTLGETRYELVEVAVHNVKTTTDSKGNKTTTLIPVFCGLIFKADFNKNFAGHTTIRQDVAERTLGFIGRGAQRLFSGGGAMELVEMESPDFEKKFKVQSTDSVQARYILTPEFMERVLEFERRFPLVQLAFKDGALIAGIPRATAFLELKSGLTDLTQSVESVMSDLIAILQIVEDLKLNERIWNKSAVGA
jgi:hypothetical protein